MSDVIKFSEFKEKAMDKEADNLEKYIFDLYYKVAEGKLTLAEMNKEILKYMSDNNISHEQFNKIQMKLIERYGYDPKEIEKGITVKSDNFLHIATVLKGKYGDSLEIAQVLKKTIKNEKNNLVLYCENKNIKIISSKRIDLDDNELHDFLVSYRRQHNEENLTITLGDSLEEFTY